MGRLSFLVAGCFLVAICSGKYLLVEEYIGDVSPSCNPQASPWQESSLFRTNYCFNYTQTSEMFTYSLKQPKLAIKLTCATSDCQNCTRTEIPLGDCVSADFEGGFAIWSVVEKLNGTNFPNDPLTTPHVVTLTFSDSHCESLSFAQTGNLTCFTNDGHVYQQQQCKDDTMYLSTCSDSTCTSCGATKTFPIPSYCASTPNSGAEHSALIVCQQ